MSTKRPYLTVDFDWIEALKLCDKEQAIEVIKSMNFPVDGVLSYYSDCEGICEVGVYEYFADEEWAKREKAVALQKEIDVLQKQLLVKQLELRSKQEQLGGLK